MPGDKTNNGKENIRQMMSNMPGEKPQFIIKEVIAENNMAMCSGNMKMKDKEGNVQDYVICDVYHFEESKKLQSLLHISSKKKVTKLCEN